MEGIGTPYTSSLTNNAFNGAIAFQRWKAAEHRQAEAQEPVLQWGHRLSAMEGVTRSTGSAGRTAFNGAIAFQRWKGVVGDIVAAAVLVLQWGHRLSAMEGTIVALRRHEAADLQWGHRLSAMEGAPSTVRCS